MTETEPTAKELRAALQGCMVQRQTTFCVGGVLGGMPISMYKRSLYPFAILGVLGSFVDYSYPYDKSCVEINEKYQLALAREGPTQ
ncbi:hypothetical protein SPRG_03476 [Saprolegnia parasitica CBS 223.65]|uniref:Uncharacterized protein n=1 Tax=Saprolegnia parasitica (strain CBS 223.65) TaxID=695850 RepID=A0A067CXL1_SAPPC|nr:hypothetical protein SPRG_03476 [Saprolegnia parasitica CBS 223.65]KDO31547.1 hypothetical protein SPRG_03476 [Saprolegnia parasitica CBS 223.65]|eukprot:XP_012197454.1 hypothetical protein SPRG_03476 [Saprolegnia parasitica CBS 223.65]